MAAAAALLQEGQCSKTAQLLSWLQKRGAYGKENPAVTIEISAHGGRGLFAAQPLGCGERILEIPCDIMITPQRLHKEVVQYLPENTSKWTQLALFLLAEWNQANASQWFPFLDMLPRQGELHHTIFWSEEELECVKHSPLYWKTLQRKTLLNNEFSAVQMALDNCTHIFGNNVSADEFSYAYSIVSSRSWKIDEACGLAMVPFMDLLNHDWTSKSILHYDEDRNCISVVADRDYAKGQEVTISYGDAPNITLAVDYGFALPYNPFDEAHIWLNISPENPQIIQALILANNQIFQHINGSIGREFSLQHTKLQNDGLPQDICEFAHIIYAQGIPSHILGQASTLNSTPEQWAMLQLSLQLRNILQPYVNQELGGSIYGIQNITRRQMAQAVLEGEQRSIEAALQCIENVHMTTDVGE